MYYRPLFVIIKLNIIESVINRYILKLKLTYIYGPKVI